MAQKKVKTRIQNKCDTFNNWGQAATFVPLKGEMIVYEAADFTDTLSAFPKGAPRVKIGDASATVEALPFIGIPVEHNFYIPDVTEDTFIPYRSDGTDYIYTLYNHNNFTIKFKPFYEVDFSKNTTGTIVCLPTKTELYLQMAFMSGTEIQVEVDTSYTIGSTNYSFTPFLRADKCLLTDWAVSNVVTNGDINSPVRTTEGGKSKFKYKITAPSDAYDKNGTMVKITLQVVGGQRLYITNEVFI
jgi:hypothetical protein